MRPDPFVESFLVSLPRFTWEQLAPRIYRGEGEGYLVTVTMQFHEEHGARSAYRYPTYFAVAQHPSQPEPVTLPDNIAERAYGSALRSSVL